jgi:hypothetical protein
VSRNSHRAGGVPLRMARLYLRPNELRRGSERVEAAVLAGLMVAFVAAIVVAVFLAAHVYRSEQAADAGLRPAAAVLSPRGLLTEAPILHEATAWATWRLSDGAERSGILTSDVVPGIYGKPPGASVRLWVDRSGVPEPPPQGRDGMFIGATIAGLAVVAAAAAVLACGYRLCQRGLDRHRLANWSSAWAITGPLWTRRQLPGVRYGRIPESIDIFMKIGIAPQCRIRHFGPDLLPYMPTRE